MPCSRSPCRIASQWALRAATRAVQGRVVDPSTPRPFPMSSYRQRLTVPKRPTHALTFTTAPMIIRMLSVCLL